MTADLPSEKCEACRPVCSCGEADCPGPGDHAGCVCVGEHVSGPKGCRPGNLIERHHARIAALERALGDTKRVIRAIAVKYPNIGIQLPAIYAGLLARRTEDGGA